MRIEEILELAVDKLSAVPGVEAVVLGGSRATGTATEHSDIDLGIYYEAGSLDVPALRCAAKELDAAGELTDPGEWGPWINGGGWLHIGGTPTDLLLRELGKVEKVIGDCIAGSITIDYQCGHPFGFVNTIYAGETASCKPLFDRNGRIGALKKLLIPYPDELKHAVREKFLWEADFSRMCGEKAVGKREYIYAAGSVFRCIVSILQVIAAENGLYLLNEKGALDRVLKCEKKPPDLAALCEQAFAGMRPDEAELRRSFETVAVLIERTRELTKHA